jgi:quercetin dioxygenase-like cupin family protein
MRKVAQALTCGFAVAALGAYAPAWAQQAPAQPAHTIKAPEDISWGPGPASIPEGAEAVVLHGNPTREGLFALRLKLPADYTIPPHTHPKPEIVTVISGTFHLGMGETLDRARARALPAGSFFAFPPGMAHFAFTEEETVIQLNSTGPWALNYINPADDPRQRPQATRTGSTAGR